MTSLHRPKLGKSLRLSISVALFLYLGAAVANDAKDFFLGGPYCAWFSLARPVPILWSFTGSGAFLIEPNQQCTPPATARIHSLPTISMTNSATLTPEDLTWRQERDSYDREIYASYISLEAWSTQSFPLEGYSYRIDLFSDLHKDALGYRPSNDFWDSLRCKGPDVLQSIWDRLCDTLDHEHTPL